MTTTPQAALLREAAQNALTTLDGIANANPRDKDDFDSPDEWIAWAKSRARWAADALRTPVAQEIYAERVLKNRLAADNRGFAIRPRDLLIFNHHQPDQKGQDMQVLEKPPLNDGEIHIAALTDAKGELYHLILLPGDNDDATHAAQMEWAKSIGGDLPSRVEQALLWERARDQFKKDWYWSNENHHNESGWAWYQHFLRGNQDCHYKANELRARAVRRLPI